MRRLFPTRWRRADGFSRMSSPLTPLSLPDEEGDLTPEEMRGIESTLELIGSTDGQVCSDRSEDPSIEHYNACSLERSPVVTTSNHEARCSGIFEELA